MTSGAAQRLVWITRAEPGAAATARRVADLGFSPLVSPLLAIEPLPAKVDLDGVEALAFTSANGVRAFLALCPERGLPVYAVGDRTAEAARAAGFQRVASADGDVVALAGLIAREGRVRRLLHPGAAEPAGDLPGLLAPSGVAVTGLALYRSVEVEPTAALTRWEGIDAALVHSPRAGRALERLMAARAAPNLQVLTISQAAADPLKHLDLRSVAVAPLPNEAALLNLLAKTIRP